MRFPPGEKDGREKSGTRIICIARGKDVNSGRVFSNGWAPDANFSPVGRKRNRERSIKGGKRKRERNCMYGSAERICMNFNRKSGAACILILEKCPNEKSMPRYC